MSSLSIKERKIYLNVKLTKETKNIILYMKEYINNGKFFRKTLVDLSLKNEQIAFCPELPFGILPFSSCADIETMKIIFF